MRQGTLCCSLEMLNYNKIFFNRRIFTDTTNKNHVCIKNCISKRLPLECSSYLPFERKSPTNSRIYLANSNNVLVSCTPMICLLSVLLPISYQIPKKRMMLIKRDEHKAAFRMEIMMPKNGFRVVYFCIAYLLKLRLFSFNFGQFGKYSIFQLQNVNLIKRAIEVYLNSLETQILNMNFV